MNWLGFRGKRALLLRLNCNFNNLLSKIFLKKIKRKKKKKKKRRRRRRKN